MWANAPSIFSLITLGDDVGVISNFVSLWDIIKNKKKSVFKYETKGVYKNNVLLKILLYYLSWASIEYIRRVFKLSAASFVGPTLRPLITH